MNKKLKEKIAESLSAVLPITVIVVALCITVTPMPLAPLTLFLADPSRGDLTEEQKSLARSSYEAVRRCYRRAAWDLLLYNQMLREGVVHDLREFRSLQRRRYAAGDDGRETRCEALCAPDPASPIPAPETGHEGV